MSGYVGLKRGKVYEKRIISEYYCGGCGWPVTDHDSYCPECGGELHEGMDKSRWHELFGTPERAANILALGCMGASENVCDSCVFRECDGKLRKCESIHSIATQMLEWLRGEGE